MSRIDDLVARLSPSGVPHLPLGEVGAFVRGNGLQKSDLRDQGIPAIHYGQIHTYYKVWAVETKSFVDPSLANRLKKASTGDLVIATTSEDDAAVGKATAWLGDSDVAVSGDAYIYHHSLDPKYVAYYFQSDAFQSQKVRFISGTKVRRISGDSLSKIKIPVPTLEVQQEVVRILDKFTRLEAELEAELEARRRQFQTFRRVLVLGDQEGDASPLGEYFRFGGINVTPDRMPEAEVSIFSLPSFDHGRVPENLAPAEVGSAKSRISEPCILIAKLNPHIPRVWKIDALGSGSYASPEFFQLVPDERLSLDYFEHLIGTLMSTLAGMVTGSTNSHKRLQREHLLNLPVHIPSVERQNQISALLNRMSTLVGDYNFGLPAEVVARRKQYEYYRDKLLTFEEAA